MTYQYNFHTTPFNHQLEGFDQSKDREAYAIFWEQGTGKSKLILDTAKYLYERKKINTLFVVAPNGVHRNWVAEETKVHYSAIFRHHCAAFAYQAPRAATKKHEVAAAAAIAHPYFTIIAISYDAFITARGKEFAKKVLTKRKCLYILDESTRIKNPKSKRTKLILGSAKYAKYKRVLTGTPITQGPFDLYTQMRFLDLDFWKAHGLADYGLFKNYFAKWAEGFNGGTGMKFPVLVEYQNLDKLQSIIDPMSSRVLKEDVLDLPEKLYSKRFFTMSKAQARLYKQLRDDFMAELSDNVIVTADMALTRLLRLQQVTCGYVAVERYLPLVDDPDYIEVIKETQEIEPGKNERLKLLMETLEDLPHKAIIWSRYTRDIDMICNALGPLAVRYDGKCTVEQKTHALESFEKCMHEDAKFFVGNPAAAATGLTLVQAKTVIYYSNSFNFEHRKQSEDRAHRIGQTESVHYIDLAAEETVDEHVIDILRGKQSLSDAVTGDRIKEWI